jgi:Spy/CpxP family protein refolding chaperone
MKRIALTLVGLVAGTTPLAAQHGHHPAPAPATTPAPSAPPTTAAPCPMMRHDSTDTDMNMGMNAMGMMDAMMTVMPRVLRFAPARLLERAAELTLTRDQVDRITAIGRRADAVRDSLAAGRLQHAQALGQVLTNAEPDPAAADGHFEAVQRAMGAMHRAELRAALEARAVLQPEQRGRVEGATPSGTQGGTAEHQHGSGH